MTPYSRLLTSLALIGLFEIAAHAQTTTFPGTVVLSSGGPSVLLQDTAGGGKTYSLSSRWGGYFTIFDESDPTDARFSINPNGTVGIGMTVPGFKLDVKNDNYNAIRATGNSSNAVGIYIQNTVSSGRQWGLLSSGGSPAPVGSFGIWDDAAGLRFTINDSGNVGIGTASPTAKLDVAGNAHIGSGNANVSNTPKGLSVQDDSGSDVALAVGRHTARSAGLVWYDSGPTGSAILYTFGNAAPITVSASSVTLSTGQSGASLYVAPNSNVGIGTTNPTHKLAVNGTIKAKEVIVETTGWSDYVFADDYTLAPLTEVEAHIREHKHLPGIPSATQVAEQGVSVGDMQAKLLAKIEELTLHQIAQEKRLSDQNREISTLKEQLSKLIDSR